MERDFTWIVSAGRVVLAGLGVAFLSGGCVIPRSPTGLSSRACPDTPVAVLPVEVSPAIDTTHYDAYEIQLLGDRVLDTLTQSESDNLIGPALVKDMLVGRQLPESIKWHRDKNRDAGTTNPLNVAFSSAFLGGDRGSWIRASDDTLDELRDLSDLLGVTEVLRSSISVVRKGARDASAAGGGGIALGVDWDVEVTVQMERIDLETAAILGRTSGIGDAGGGAGVILFVFPIPYYNDSTLGRGIDHACRAALEEMFAQGAVP